ncbi:craniofacial development protein 2-like [Ctenocephalides felis]|uniref:craniofacial development protein 2-like n=1 Tax=Ctenocephalides felis TaxID=7515 RepID=UPI000E6E275F|nr:craniofacial development protein 2-like [Ctenocephalides felis]
MAPDQKVRSAIRMTGTAGPLAAMWKGKGEYYHITFFPELATWNVRTMMRAGKLENLKREMDKCKVDVVGLSEVRWQGQGKTESDGFTMYYSGGDKSERGVAVMCENESGAGGRDGGAGVHADIAPRRGGRRTNLRADEMLSQEGKGKVNVVIMGDFNAVVGNGSEEEIVGKYGLGRRNDRGNMLIDFCRQKQSDDRKHVVQKAEDKVIYLEKPGDSERHQIDYIIVKNRFRNSVKDVKTYPGADVDSDHNLLTADIETKPKNIRKTGKKRQRWNLENMRNNKIVVRKEMESKFSVIKDREEAVEKDWMR